jgi:hypothetical protein
VALQGNAVLLSVLFPERLEVLLEDCCHNAVMILSVFEHMLLKDSLLLIATLGIEAQAGHIESISHGTNLPQIALMKHMMQHKHFCPSSVTFATMFCGSDDSPGSTHAILPIDLVNSHNTNRPAFYLDSKYDVGLLILTYAFKPIFLIFFHYRKIRFDEFPNFQIIHARNKKREIGLENRPERDHAVGEKYYALFGHVVIPLKGQNYLGKRAMQKHLGSA